MPFVTASREHRHRRWIGSLLSAAAGAATIYTGNAIAYNVALIGFSYRLLTSVPITRKGWASVRGMVIGLLSYITLCLVIVAGILFFTLKDMDENKDTPPKESTDINDIDEEQLLKLTSFSNSVITAFIGKFTRPNYHYIYLMKRIIRHAHRPCLPCRGF